MLIRSYALAWDIKLKVGTTDDIMISTEKPNLSQRGSGSAERLARELWHTHIPHHCASTNGRLSPKKQSNEALIMNSRGGLYARDSDLFVKHSSGPQDNLSERKH